MLQWARIDQHIAQTSDDITRQLNGKSEKLKEIKDAYSAVSETHDSQTRFMKIQ